MEAVHSKRHPRRAQWRGGALNSALIGMAVLTINSDRRRQDALENFVPLVLDRLYEMRSKYVSTPELQSQMLSEYRLNIPLNVLNSILRRCKRRGLLAYEAKALTVDVSKLKQFSLTSVRQEVRTKHTYLTEAGVSFARDFFEVDLSHEEMAQEIQAYIQLHAAPLLSTVIESRPLVEEVPSEERNQIIVSAFISQAIDDPRASDYLRDVVKGSLLMSALYFPDATVFEQRLSDLHAYFDTTVLLRAVGACGPNLQLAATELLDLARGRSMKLHCFTHTVDEMRGVLLACRRAVQNRSGWYNGEATEYMVTAGWDVSEVLQLSEELEERLGELGIDIRNTPRHDAAFQIDEAKLEDSLDLELHYRNPTARQRDVDSASAVFTLRKGRESARLASAGAVFITSNTDLVRAVRNFFRINEHDRESIPIFMADYVLTTVLWLSSPLTAPELPLRELIADCYATMRGSDAPWRDYVEKLDKLRREGRVTTERYVMMRQSLLVRAQIMLATDFDAAMFTEDTAHMVLARAQKTMYQEVMKSLQLEQRRLAEAQEEQRDRIVELSGELTTAQARENRAEAKQQQLIDTVTRWVASLILLLVMMVSTLGALFAMPTLGDLELGGLVGFAVSACVALTTALSLISLFTGRTGPDLAAWLEKALKPHISKALNRNLD